MILKASFLCVYNLVEVLRKNGLTVNWKAVSGAKGYEVRYYTSAKMTNAWCQDLASIKTKWKILRILDTCQVFVSGKCLFG